MKSRRGIIDNEPIKDIRNIDPDKCAYLPASILKSEPYKKLTVRQKLLCIACEFQWYERKPMHDYPYEELFQDEDCFYLSWRDARKYGLRYSGSLFYKDMKALREAGFIEKVARAPHSQSVYRYSDAWKTRG